MKKQNLTSSIILHVVLCSGIVISVFPFVWMILTSFKTPLESMQVPPEMLPDSFSFDAYERVITILPFVSSFINTIISTLIIVAGQLIFCSMAGYGFARINFPFKNVIFVVLLSVLMIPSQIFIIPQYLIIQNLGLLDSMGGLVLPSLFSVFGTFLMRQYFMSLPAELEESAIIDGCNRFNIYLRIMLPLTKSGIVALIIFTSKYAWNNFMWPLIITTSPDKMTLAPTLARLASSSTIEFPSQMAGAVMTVIPMILVFIIFQKHFIAGVASSGIKG